MSPELFLHDDVSPALDIYSFGIIGESAPQEMNANVVSRCSWVAIFACCALMSCRSSFVFSCRAVHIMCTGRDPYQDMAAPMIILAKVCPLGSKSLAKQTPRPAALACLLTLQLGSLELLL